MKVSEFDYFLPTELIAQFPVEPRDASRLLVLHKDSGTIEHKIFREIKNYLLPGDLLVLNSTKVITARLHGEKQDTGAKVEIFLLRNIKENQWEILSRPAKRLREGTIVNISPELKCTVVAELGEGKKIVNFNYEGDFQELLEKYGEMPLPPYIKEKLSRNDRYQTVYANASGSVAAPTAGLHFTADLLKELKGKGIDIVTILLHVGLGTFKPVTTDEIEHHKMHSEYYEISQEAAEKINDAKKEGRRVIAVGTTSVRTLESAVLNGQVKAGVGWTDIFIYPGFKFQIVDCLLTNFHLPKSTLLMLVSAFASKEQIMHAYEEAVKNKYRFFSFGDAMFII